MQNNSNAPIWISAGETSGDIHGAELLKALRKALPDRRFIGMGGPAMREAGLDCLYDIKRLSVMGITEVVSHLPGIMRLFGEIEISLKLHRPAALVVIDSPDFHFRVIEKAAALNIPVYYYISPKLWAWRQGRAKFIKKHVKRLISILPFEEEFYKKFGVQVDYVGNPLVDLLNLEELDKIPPQPEYVGILPGSRKSEVLPLVPEFAAAASIMHAARPELEFHCVRAPGIDAEQLRALWKSPAPLHLHEPEGRYELMRRCNIIMAASGTATLECALIGTPTLVAYKVSALSGLVGKTFIKVPYVSLPNLIARKEVFPEFLQADCKGEKLAATALAWLRPQNSKLEELRKELAELRHKVGEPGVAERAARVIAQDFR